MKSMSSLFQRSVRRHHSRDAAKRQHKRRSLSRGLEALETRALLTGLAFEVINLNDTGTGSLREAVELANANPGKDTVEFADGLTGTISLSEQIEITDDLLIDGPGADVIEVSGAGVTRAFVVAPEVVADNPDQFPTIGDLDDAPAVKIEDLSINDGMAIDVVAFPPQGTELSGVAVNPGYAFGGGLLNLGGSVTLSGVSMSGNTAAGLVSAGGAVANEFGGTLTVLDSHFSENVSSGALIAVGGAITSDLGPQQDADGVYGEVVDGSVVFNFTTDQPEVTVRGSEFVGNRTEVTSGYIDGVAFSGLSGGGAILNVTGIMTISKSEFVGNQALGGSGTVVAAPTAGGTGIGGAINSGNISPFGAAASELVIRDSVFVKNLASGGDGSASGVAGGLGRGGAVTVNNLGTAKLYGNRFRGNSAEGGQGGADASGGIADGGAISTSGGSNLTLQRNALIGNQATGGAGAVEGEGLGAYGRGGAIANTTVDLAGLVPGLPSTVTINRDRMIDNTAIGGIGGAAYNEGAMVIERARIQRNQAIGHADATADFTIGYVFRGTALGGGVANNEGMLTMHSTRVIGNESIGDDDVVGRNFNPANLAEPSILPGMAIGAGIDNRGGGVQNPGNAVVSAEDAGSVSIDGSTISGNIADAGDGAFGSFAGVAIGAGIYNDATLSIVDSAMRGNRAEAGDGGTADFNPGTAFGGGIASGTFTAAVTERTAELTVRGSKFIGNRSIGGDGNTSLLGENPPPAQAGGSGFGGGIHVYEGTADITRSKVRNNRAIGGEGASAAAGGIFIFGYIDSVTGNATTGNISQTVVANNRAVAGAGADAFGGGITVGSFGSIFSGFVSGATGANAELERVILRNNRVIGGRGGDGSGGGLYSGTDSDVDVRRAFIYRNVARGGVGGDGLGGGVFNAGGVPNEEDSEMDITLSLIFGNRAQRGGGGDGIGGGIYNEGDLDLLLTAVFANWASDSDDDCFGC